MSGVWNAMNRTVTGEDVRASTPYMRQTASGWLAISSPGSPIRIATEGSTEDEARAAFAAALEAWAALREQPEPTFTNKLSHYQPEASA